MHYHKAKIYIEKLAPEGFRFSNENIDGLWIGHAQFNMIDSNVFYESEIYSEDTIEINLFGIEGLYLIFEGSFPYALTIGDISSLLLGPFTPQLKIDNENLRKVELDEETNEFIELENHSIIIELADISVLYENEQVNISSDIDISLPYFTIGNTGIVIKVNNLIPIFSEKRTNDVISQIPSHWRGLYLDSLQLFLPKEFNNIIPSNLIFENCFIGTGGFTGRITGNWNPSLSTDLTSFSGNGSGDLLGIPFAMHSLAIELKQNTFVESSILGFIILPFFDFPLTCNITIQNNGDFLIGLSVAQELIDALPEGSRPSQEEIDNGIWSLTKEGLIDLKVKSLELEKRDNTLLFHIAGDIRPLLGGDSIDWPEIQIPRLTIDSNGNVEVEGGWLSLTEQKTIGFKGFNLEVSAIGFGKENDEKWVGFSGGINIVESLPFKGGVEGLKVLWDDGGNIRFSISGINVEFDIAKILNFKGRISFFEEGAKKGFKGSISAVLHALDGAGLTGEFFAGRNTADDPYNFFFIFLDLTLPVGIPLGNTGASIFGFSGLFGYNVYPDKANDEGWFANEDGSDGYFLKSPKGITSSSKWKDQKDGFALGAGMTLGSAVDNGFSYNTGMLFTVIVPGPVIAFVGINRFVSAREGEESFEGSLTIGAILDLGSGTFDLNITGGFKYDSTGKIVDINVYGELFLDFTNSNNWHLYIGKKSPNNRRIRASILKIFNADTYLMISPSLVIQGFNNDQPFKGVAFGIYIGYDKEFKFGPAKMKFYAYSTGEVIVSLDPKQIEGSVELAAGAEVKVWGKGVELGRSVRLSVKTPKPFEVKASICFKLPIVGEKCIPFNWSENPRKYHPIKSPIAKVGIEHIKVTDKWDATESTMDENDMPIVPMDGKPVITFRHPVIDQCGVGLNASSSSASHEIGNKIVDYYLTGITIEKKSPNGTFTEVSSLSTEDLGQAEVNSIWGNWQLVNNQGENDNLKLMLWVNSPFAIAREMGDNRTYITGSTENLDSYICPPDTELEETCIDFVKYNEGEQFYPMFYNEELLFLSNNALKYPFEIESFDNRLLLRFGNSKSNNSFTVIFPKNIQKVVIIFRGTIDYQLIVNYTNGSRVELLNTNEVNSSNDIQSITIKSKEIIRIKRICYCTEHDIYNHSIAEDTDSFRVERTIQSFENPNSIIFDPDTVYKITTSTRHSENGVLKPEKSESYYFKTASPPGCVNIPDEIDNNSNFDDKFPYGGALKDLRPYVETTIPNETASNEVRYPHFRSYDIGIKFNEFTGKINNDGSLEENEGYITTMYALGGYNLLIKLFDNNNREILDLEGNVLELLNYWSKNANMVRSFEESQWSEVIDGNESCYSQYEDNYLSGENDIYVGHPDFLLNPNSNYKAKLIARKNNGESKIIFDFNFLSSRFRSFTHLVNSFKNIVWDKNNTNAFLNPFDDSKILVLNEIFQTVELGLENGLDKETEAMKFEQLVSLFELGIRSTPAQLEIFNINTDTENLALLMEFPEPIQWERILLTFEKLQGNRIKEIFPVTSDLQISNIETRFNRGNFSADTEYIDIAVNKKVNLLGYSLVKKDTRADTSDTIMVFEDSSLIAEGRTIRIHTKSLTREYDDDLIHISQNKNKLQFNDKHSIVELVNPKGSIVHSVYVNSIKLKKVPFKIIRNQDKTKAILVHTTGSGRKVKNIKSSISYKINFEFRGNAQNQLSNLKRLGATVNEDVFINFELK